MQLDKEYGIIVTQKLGKAYYSLSTSIAPKSIEALVVLTGYHDNHIVIRWFWAAVERFNNEQRLRLLQVRNQLICVKIIQIWC